MGSDLYTVSVRTYREHTTEGARARLAAYGHGPAAADFFSGEGPWIEIRLDLCSIHPDAPIGWDPLFLIRLLDEAVYRSARTDGSGWDFERTPLAERYPGLWKMGMNLEKEEDGVVKIVEVEYRKNPQPREGRADDPYGDTGTIAAFVHKKYAPNIADFGWWESRAWGGGGWFWRNFPAERPPIRAEIRPVRAALHMPSTDHNEYTTLAPRAGGGVWAATQTCLFAVTATAEGEGRAEQVLDLMADTRVKVSGVARLAAQADGTLWMQARNAIVRRAPTGETTVFERGKALPCKKIEHLDASPDGHVFAGSDAGLFCLEPDGQWTLVRDGLAERAVRRVTALPGGAAWIVGNRHVTRRNADGSLERFQSRQGIDSAYQVAALPDGGVWAIAFWKPPAYVAPGAGRAVPDEVCAGVLPGGVRHVATGPDGALWCTGMRGYLARLRNGDVPRAYVWDGPPTGLWDDVAEIAVAPEGDVWLRLGGGVIAGVRASDLAAADAAPPLNADMPHLAGVRPASFGPAQAAPGGAPTIDFKGKTVVITGTLSKLTRAEAQRVLADRGAVLSDAVNKKTDYLIVGIKPSSKLKKAQSLGIPVLDEDALL